MSEQLGRIGIASHVFKMIDFKCHFNHLLCVASWARNYELVLIGKDGLDSATARNKIVEKALEEKCDHVLFMDADHLFPLETLACLLETRDEAMVSGVVSKRGEGFRNVAFQKSKDGGYIPWTPPLDGRVYEVGVCAFGATLINLKLLAAKIEKPWFRDTCISPNGTDEPYNFRSDINLCDAFRARGEKCWIDTRVLIGHLGVEATVYPQNFELEARAYDMMKATRKLTNEQKGCYYYDPD